MASAVSVICAALVMTGCTSCSGARQRADEWSRAPDQYACTLDDDCVVAPYHFDDELCCNASYTSVQASGFVRWRDSWQAAECGRVDCAAARAEREPSLPAQEPLPCYFEPRCNEGRCGGSCGLVSDDPDGDGIVGDADGCPDRPEDCDGEADGDGCVDSDDDEDGIPDVCDACPNEAEFANAYEDDDGCPDIAPTPDALPFVWFDAGSASPRSEAVLDAWAEALRTIPTGHVWISAAGTLEEEPLLEQRAANVVDALVRRGISGARLETSTGGFPDASQGTERDWALIRRGSSRPIVAMGPTMLPVYGERVVPPSCPPREGRGAPCPPAPTSVTPSWRLASGVVEVDPGTLDEACAALAKGEYPDFGETCRRISAPHPGGRVFASAYLVSVPIRDVDEPVWLALETAEGVRFFFRLSNGRSGPVSDGRVAVTNVRSERLFGGEEEALVVEWESAWTAGEEVGEDDARWSGRVATTTVCAFVGEEPACRSIPTRVATDEVRIRNERVHEWRRTRERVDVEWLPGGSVRIRAAGRAGSLAPLVGEHRWSDVPVVDVGD